MGRQCYLVLASYCSPISLPIPPSDKPSIRFEILCAQVIPAPQRRSRPCHRAAVRPHPRGPSSGKPRHPQERPQRVQHTRLCCAYLWRTARRPVGSPPVPSPRLWCACRTECPLRACGCSWPRAPWCRHSSCSCVRAWCGDASCFVCLCVVHSCACCTAHVNTSDVATALSGVFVQRFVCTHTSRTSVHCVLPPGGCVRPNYTHDRRACLKR